MIRQGQQKPNFWFGNQLYVKKVSTPYNVCHKTLPLINCAKIYVFFKIFHFLKEKYENNVKNETKKIFFQVLGPTKMYFVPTYFQSK